MTKELNENVKETIRNFEKENNVIVVYVTEFGSKLYGTNNENSDTDYKGIFIPSVESVLLKKDLEHWTSNTNNTNQKNSNTDVDLHLVSIHNFFQLLKKGETGAIDLLFSMWSDSSVYDDKSFTDLMKGNYKSFLNRRLHSFTGYAVGQAQKYGIKGTRYKEVQEFYEYLDKQFNTSVKYKLEHYFTEFKDFFEDKGFKYLKITVAQGPKTGRGENLIDYVEVLGKKYSADVTFNYFFDKMSEAMKGFGNRTKASSEGVDFKALSHSVRVLFEVEELLDSRFITFPLRERDFVKEVKEGRVDVDEVMDFINTKLDEVKEKLENDTSLPEESDIAVLEDIELSLLRGTVFLKRDSFH